MYKTYFLCTYKLHDDDNQEDMYRIDYLNAFGLQQFDGDKIIKIVEFLYEKFKNNIDLKEILEKHHYFHINPYNNIPNYEFVFQTLFSFETFDIFHKCIIILLNNTYIDQENKIELYKIYNKYKK